MTQLSSALSALGSTRPQFSSGIISLEVPIEQQIDAISWLHAQCQLPRCFFSTRKQTFNSDYFSNGSFERFPNVGSAVFFQHFSHSQIMTENVSRGFSLRIALSFVHMVQFGFMEGLTLILNGNGKVLSHFTSSSPGLNLMSLKELLCLRSSLHGMIRFFGHGKRRSNCCKIQCARSHLHLLT